jgi:hypothetical protein
MSGKSQNFWEKPVETLHNIIMLVLMHKPPVMLQYYKRSEMAEIEYRVVRRSKS